MEGPSDQSPSHARPRRRRSAIEGTTEARIEIVADLMRTAKFRRGRTAKELAKKWELSLDRVHDLTAEASKRVVAEFRDPERVTIKVASSLERIIDEEMAKPSSRRQSRNIIEAGKVLLLLTGANAPERHDVNVNSVTLEAIAKAREAAKANEE